jgi:suppressor of G2 allele of SKP1
MYRIKTNLLDQCRREFGVLSSVSRCAQELEQKGELDDGDPLSNFFKKIFAQVSFVVVAGERPRGNAALCWAVTTRVLCHCSLQGDENQQRAMMKSYVESNGTVLSTNWNEVGSKKVECSPPEGMEPKPNDPWKE